MSFNNGKITETFIIEPIIINTGLTTTSITACTSVYTNALISCSGDTQILMSTGVITFDGSLYTNDDLTANTINASTFYSGGTNLLDIININNITGGTFNNASDTLTLHKTNGNIIVTGLTDFYTTGATLIGNTVYFNRNDALSAYTLDLSHFSTQDIYTTGVTFNNNQLIISRNDGVSLNTFINTFTGLTINGLLNVNSISADTISATTFYGDGSKLTGISSITGGTFNSSTDILILSNSTGGTITITGFTDFYTTGATLINNIAYFNRNDVLSAYTLDLNDLAVSSYITGATFSNNNLILTNNTGGTISVLVNNFSGLTINGDLTVTGNSYANNFSGNSGTFLSISGNGTNITGLPYVTGGTYNTSTGIASFTNSTGNTFNVNGFFKPSDDIYSTGLTINNATYDLTIIRNDGVKLITNLGTLASDVTITGGSYNTHTGVVTFTNNTGGTFTVSGFTTGITDTRVSAYSYDNANTFTILDSTGGTFNASINIVTGLTVNGNLMVNTISATTYENLPIDISVTGGTYSAGTTTFTNNTGGTFSVSGFNTSVDTYVTGFTYNNNIFTITNSTGGTISALINNMTGLTVNGILNVTGNTNISGNTVVSGLTSTTFTNGSTLFPTIVGASNILFATSANTIGSDNNFQYTAFDPVNGGRALYINAAASANTGNNYILGNYTGGGGVTVLNSPSLLGSIVMRFQNGGNVFDITSDNSGVSGFFGGRTFYIGNPTAASAKLQVGGSLSLASWGTVGVRLALDSSTFTDTSASGTRASAVSDAFNRPTFAASNTAVTITNAATVYIAGTPISGTNVTFTNAMSLWVASGLSRFDDNVIVSGLMSATTISATNITANTISATTYLNLPISTDIHVTGFTYNNNTFTIIDNTNTSYVASINSVTGLTVNGTLSANTISATTYLNLPSTAGFVPYTGATKNVNLGIFNLTANTLTANDTVNTGTTFSNTIIGFANTNNYAQINIQNQFTGSGSSVDIVATADNGNENINYIDMGINSSTFSSGFVGNSNDAYIYSTGKNLLIGNISTGQTIVFFTDSSNVSASTRLTISSANTISTTPIYAPTLSATTYLNLPSTFDTKVTGFSYNNNIFTINDNLNSAYTATINTMTGLTVNGKFSATTITASTVSATTISGSSFVTNITDTDMIYSSAGVLTGSGNNVWNNGTATQTITGSLTCNPSTTGLPGVVVGNQNTTNTYGNNTNTNGIMAYNYAAGYNASVFYGLQVRNTSTGALSAGNGAGIIFGLTAGGSSFLNTKLSSYVTTSATGGTLGNINSAYGFQTAISGTVAERFTMYADKFGVGVTVPGAFIDIVGSTSGLTTGTTASLRIRSGTTVTTPNQGDIWNDNTYLNINGLGLKVTGGTSQYSIISATTISSTTFTNGSTLFPTSITANQVLYATATNTIGSSAGLTYNGTDTLQIGSAANVTTLRTGGGAAFMYTTAGSGTNLIPCTLQNVNVVDQQNGNPAVVQFYCNSLSGMTMGVGVIKAAGTQHNARLDITGSTTTLSAIRVHSGSTVTAPGQGDIWNDNTNLNISGLGIKLTSQGSKINIASGGTAASVGQITLTSGTAVVNTTNVTSSSLIFLSSAGGTITNIGQLYANNSDIVAGTSFKITSTNVLDTSTVNWYIIN